MTADPLSNSLAPGFDDPLGMLVACHRRIERELITLGRLQRHLPEHGCDDAARAAASRSSSISTARRPTIMPTRKRACSPLRAIAETAPAN
jgi:hypothetical protein